MIKKFKVAGIGEVLWDQLPKGDVLGGAPLNVAYHMGQLGLESYIISAIGNDKPGNDAITQLKSKNINLLLNRVDHPTGTVKVILDDNGVPDFTIAKDVAWDYIELTNEISKLASVLDAICFGSLAQRNVVSRNTILSFLDLVPENALKIFDINLRQEFYTKELICKSLEIANILKVNEEELPIVSGFFGYKGDNEYICSKLIDDHNLELVAYTIGANGSYLFSKNSMSFLKTPEVKVKDTVGAGDSFTAALIVSLLNGCELSECHKLAVDLASFVCSNDGAMPDYSNSLRERINRSIKSV
jgi:fructokinase